MPERHQRHKLLEGRLSSRTGWKRRPCFNEYGMDRSGLSTRCCAAQFGRRDMPAANITCSASGPRRSEARRAVTRGSQTSPLVAGLGSLIMGFGMGFLSTAAIVLIQDSVGWTERGAATASNLFARNLGSTLGAAVLGTVLNASLARDHSGSLQRVQELLHGQGAIVGAAASRAGLVHGLHLTFWGVLIIALLAVLLSVFVPRVTFGTRPPK